MPPHPLLEQQVTFLYARDAAACWSFYEGLLQLRLVQDQGAARIYEVAAGRAFLGICTATGPRVSDDPRVEGGVCFTFVTPEVDGWYDHLRAAGATIAHPPRNGGGGRIYHFFLHDPAGNLLEFQRFETADWPAPG